MSQWDELFAEPWRFDFFMLMRELERQSPDKPRIGDSTVLAEEYVALGQNPFMSFPASNVASVETGPSGTPRVMTQFLGYFGPQGALPIHVTEEAFQWNRGRDPSFSRFTDIFATRFQQLFYRAWADSRAIAQSERPEHDRFFDYIGSFAGVGTRALKHADTVDDIAKLPFAGLVNGRVKSAGRLRKLLHGLFGIDVEIEEWTGSWLKFGPDDRLSLGRGAARLSEDAFLGGKVYSINEKITVRIRCRDLDEYRRFLPSGVDSRKLTDAIFFYVGCRQEFEIRLGLAAHLAPPVGLGKSGNLGWTAWMPAGDDPKGWRFDARFNPVQDFEGDDKAAATRPS